MLIERILLPTDFSEPSVRAARIARELAQVSGATVHVLHVAVPVEQALPAPEVGVLLRRVLPDEPAIQEMLDAFGRRYLAIAGVPFVTAVRYGRPAPAIARYAREARIDRLIIGTHARGPLHRLWRPSLSAAVLHRAPCPVVMVPPAVPLEVPAAGYAPA